MDWYPLILTTLALILGGILKGATGAGAPIVTVPVVAILYDVQTAVALLAIPNLLTNSYQGWRYRKNLKSPRLAAIFAIAGLIGAAVGTVMLVSLPSEALMVVVAFTVFGYIGFRLMRPDWVLSRPLAMRLAAPVGVLGGILQGAAGISAPASITFLNAIRLERPEFIATISLFFFAMCIPQTPMLIGYGVITWHMAALSVFALIPIFGAMPIGAWLASRISRETFDRIILILLAVLSLRLLAHAAGLF